MRASLVIGWIFVGGLTAMADAPVKVASIEGVTEYRLANGSRVLLFPEASRPTVTVNMTVLVGSRHEGYGEAGMAHLLEHMVFKGTPKHPEVPKSLRDHGASFNGRASLFDRPNPELASCGPSGALAAMFAGKCSSALVTVPLARRSICKA